MSTLTDRENELIELFEWIEDSTDRYIQIIDYGKELEPIDDSLKIEANEVKGCQSKVWLTHQFENGKLILYADSNTAITKGIVAMLIYLWSGLSPREILNTNTEVLEKIKLREHLTSQRSNGLTAMIETIKNIARRYE